MRNILLLFGVAMYLFLVCLSGCANKAEIKVTPKVPIQGAGLQNNFDIPVELRDSIKDLVKLTKEINAGRDNNSGNVNIEQDNTLMYIMIGFLGLSKLNNPFKKKSG